MVQLTFLILTWLTAIHAVIAAPQSISVSSIASTLLSTNVTLGSDSPDPRFHTSPTIGPDLLPVNSTLINVLFFMAEMAYYDQDESIAANAWDAPDAPGVTIVTEETIQAKYLQWGAYAGIQYMINNTRFNEALLILRWDLEIVGRIWIVAPNSILNLASNTTGLDLAQRSNHPRAADTNNGIEALLSATEIANGTNSLDAHPQVGITTVPGGKRLTRFDVFLVCYAALVHIAPSKPETQLQDFIGESPLSPVLISLYNWGPGVIVGHVIQVLVFLPRAMLKSELGFREVTFFSIHRGVRVLEGSIKQGAAPSSLASE